MPNGANRERVCLHSREHALRRYQDRRRDSGRSWPEQEFMAGTAPLELMVVGIARDMRLRRWRQTRIDP